MHSSYNFQLVEYQTIFLRLNIFGAGKLAQLLRTFTALTEPRFTHMMTQPPVTDLTLFSGFCEHQTQI